MTMRPDGAVHCDRCGVDLQNGGVDKCVVVTGLTNGGGRVETWHLCLKGLPDGEGCTTRVLTRAALAWYVDNVGEKGATPDWFDPTPMESGDTDDADRGSTGARMHTGDDAADPAPAESAGAGGS